MTDVEANELKSWLAQEGWTRDKLAAQLGVSRQTVQNYLSGKHPIPDYIVLALWALKNGARLG